MTRFPRSKTRAFTLIEMLVVVAIIALLISILLPSLRSARLHTKTVVCAANLHNIGLAVANYLYGSRGTYPASYVYAIDHKGSWSVKNQSANHPFGYLHWSFFMYDGGKVGDDGFRCPMFENGGAPRTNPGRDAANWEGGQTDQNSDGAPNDLEDMQATRMSYAANAAIMPRNKFTTELSGGLRVNRFVKENEIRRGGNTVLVAEYLNNWKALGIQSGNGILSKSHRPINPFFHVGSGFDEYKASPQSPGFIYGLPQDQKNYGLLALRDVRNKVNILDHTSGVSQVNAVGRHHPTTDRVYNEVFGGESNFLFVDGHTETMTPLETLRKRMWGERYYGISGANEIMNMSTVFQGQ